MSNIKPKLSLRAGINAAEKSPSPSAKLMLSHGKPNFTINRSISKTNTQCPFSPTKPEASVLPVLKSTASATSNGYAKPSTLKIPLSGENEINKVILRRTKLPEENGKPVQSDEEPEFVKAQRKIAERLANQNSLDFESRKSGYFTHVMMSPTSPTRQMEVPVIADHKIEKAFVVQVESESTESFETPKDFHEAAPEQTKVEAAKKENVEAQKPPENGQENGDASQLKVSTEVEEKPIEVIEAAKALIEELVQTVVKDDPDTEEDFSKSIKNGQEYGIENGVTNGASNGDDGHSHENSHSSQSDVNFEHKTITSFARDLSSEANKYPDEVKVSKDVKPAELEEFVQDMYKVKFDIHADEDDVKVSPTIRTNE